MVRSWKTSDWIRETKTASLSKKDAASRQLLLHLELVSPPHSDRRCVEGHISWWSRGPARDGGLKEAGRLPRWHWLKAALLGHQKRRQSLVAAVTEGTHTQKEKPFLLPNGQHQCSHCASQAGLSTPPEAQPLRCSLNKSNTGTHSRPTILEFLHQEPSNLHLTGIWGAFIVHPTVLRTAALCSLVRALQPEFRCSGMPQPPPSSLPLGQGLLVS